MFPPGNGKLSSDKDDHFFIATRQNSSKKLEGNSMYFLINCIYKDLFPNRKSTAALLVKVNSGCRAAFRYVLELRL